MAKFFLVYVALQWLIIFAPVQPLQESIAAIEANALGLKNAGSAIETADGLFEINSNCTGLVSAAVLAAIIFSLKKPDFKKKLMVFFTGAIALLLLNLARIYFVLLVAINVGIEAAELAHIASWFGTTAFIIAIWYIGAKKIAGSKKIEEMI